MADPFKTNVKSRKINALPHNLGPDGRPRPEAPRPSLLEAHNWDAFDAFKRQKMPSREFVAKPTAAPAPAPAAPNATDSEPIPDSFEQQKLTLNGSVEKIPSKATVPTTEAGPAWSDRSKAQPQKQRPIDGFDRALEKRYPGWNQMTPEQRKATLTPTDRDDAGNTYTLNPRGEIRAEYNPKDDHRIVQDREVLGVTPLKLRRKISFPAEYGGGVGLGKIDSY